MVYWNLLKERYGGISFEVERSSTVNSTLPPSSDMHGLSHSDSSCTS